MMIEVNLTLERSGDGILHFPLKGISVEEESI